MPSKTETRVYIAAFVVIGLITLMECSYQEGRISEADAHRNEVVTAITDQQQKAEFWKGKYVALSKETDAITVMAAESHLEQERAGR